MLQLDGYDLIGDNESTEIQTLINKYIPLKYFMPWVSRNFPGWELQAITLPAGLRPEPEWELNRFRCPTGATRWAYGHFLCDSDTYSQIAADAFSSSGKYNTISFTIGNPESNSGGSIQAGETLTTPVFLLPGTPLSGIRGVSGMTRSLYLLTIVDCRYFWWWQNSGPLTTIPPDWGSFISAIATILNVTINYDTIPQAYLAPSLQTFNLPYAPVPMILDAIGYNIQQRLVSNLDGVTFTFQQYSTALSAFNNDMEENPNRIIVAGGQRFANPL